MQRKNLTLKELCKNFILSKQVNTINNINEMKLTNDLKEELIEDFLQRDLLMEKQEELFKKGLASEEAALQILGTKLTCDVLGCYDPISLHNLFENAPIDYKYSKIYTGEYIFELGKAHKKAAEYILKNLSEKISPEQKTALEVSLDPPAPRRYWSKFGD